MITSTRPTADNHFSLHNLAIGCDIYSELGSKMETVKIYLKKSLLLDRRVAFGQEVVSDLGS